MHQYISDITHCFVWLVSSKWLQTYTDIHAPSKCLFFNLTAEPTGRYSLIWTDFGQSLTSSHSERRHAFFPGAMLISGNSKRGKKTPTKQHSFSEENKLERSCIYVCSYGSSLHFLSAKYKMFPLMYHILPYLLILICEFKC